MKQRMSSPKSNPMWPISEEKLSYWIRHTDNNNIFRYSIDVDGRIYLSSFDGQLLKTCEEYAKSISCYTIIGIVVNNYDEKHRNLAFGVLMDAVTLSEARPRKPPHFLTSDDGKDKLLDYHKIIINANTTKEKKFQALLQIQRGFLLDIDEMLENLDSPKTQEKKVNDIKFYIYQYLKMLEIYLEYFDNIKLFGDITFRLPYTLDYFGNPVNNVNVVNILTIPNEFTTGENQLLKYLVLLGLSPELINDPTQLKQQLLALWERYGTLSESTRDVFWKVLILSGIGIALLFATAKGKRMFSAWYKDRRAHVEKYHPMRIPQIEKLEEKYESAGWSPSRFKYLFKLVQILRDDVVAVRMPATEVDMIDITVDEEPVAKKRPRVVKRIVKTHNRSRSRAVSKPKRRIIRR